MLRSMTWEQLFEWRQYFSLEPFGEERADLRVAINTATLAEINRNPKKRSKSYQASDFMPKFGVRAAKRAPLTDPAEWARLKSSLKASFGPSKVSNV